jgi:hypothetical protein
MLLRAKGRNFPASRADIHSRKPKGAASSGEFAEIGPTTVI